MLIYHLLPIPGRGVLLGWVWGCCNSPALLARCLGRQCSLWWPKKALRQITAEAAVGTGEGSAALVISAIVRWGPQGKIGS